jgi:head-tail adaptor
MRLTSGSRSFEIVAVVDIDERRRWLKCLCVERDL